MKIDKHNFKFSMMLLATLMVVSVFFGGCQNDFNIDQDIIGLPYLTLSDNNHSLKLSDADRQTFIKAYQRMEITKENGTYKTKWTSGSQINISEDLFNMFRNGIICSNQLNDKFKHKSPRFKSDSEDGGTNSGTDCVQQAIWNVIYTFGGTSSYSDVNDWITNTYGNYGVPASSFVDACGHFLNGYQITLDDNTFSSNNGVPPSGQKVIVALINNTSIGHAAVLIMCFGGAVWYRDTDGTERVTFTSNILNAYQASGCK
ncbi:MAG: hypothetical protein PHQ11_06235 [Paludibacter sp.]|nr:hypothetical protein [Paludibacter sp.]MDD4199358.1 hypothetical protein [Paludibacter sp.]MDD4427809.1 hypothetical protein [Paludibacter sp.]